MLCAITKEHFLLICKIQNFKKILSYHGFRFLSFNTFNMVNMRIADAYTYDVQSGRVKKINGICSHGVLCGWWVGT